MGNFGGNRGGMELTEKKILLFYAKMIKITVPNFVIAQSAQRRTMG
jgi:hypothetical protein